MTTRLESGPFITGESVISETIYVTFRPDISEYEAFGIPRPLTLSEAPAVSLVKWLEDKTDEFGPEVFLKFLRNNLLQIYPYIDGFAGLATLLQSDDSYAGCAWTYPALRTDCFVCQVIGKGLGEDDEKKVQILLPTLDGLRQIVRSEELWWQWQSIMDEIKGKLIQSTIPLAQQAIPRALRTIGTVVENPREIMPTRFSGVKDDVNIFRNRQYVNEEIPIWHIYPLEGVPLEGLSKQEKGAFVKLDIEYAF